MLSKFLHRRSLRLPNYDYSGSGYYFITICSQDRTCLFGEIANQSMVLNARGKMVENWWQKISVQFPLVQLDRYQIMPNHVHGIIIINEIFIDPVGVDPRVDPCIDIGRTHRSAPTTFGRTHRSAPTLGTIIQWFKTMTTNEYIRHVKHDSWEPFNQRVWQRNYYEHIIRSQKNLGAIREYIMNNPRGWDKDQDNPENFSRRSSQRT